MTYDDRKELSHRCSLNFVKNKKNLRVWVVEVIVFHQHCFSSVVASQIQVVVILASEHGVAPVVERFKDTFVLNGDLSIFLEANED